MLVTLTLDRVALHTIVHHSSTSTYMPNSTKVEETFVDRQTDGPLRTTLLDRLRRVDLTINKQTPGYKVSYHGNLCKICFFINSTYYS